MMQVKSWQTSVFTGGIIFLIPTHKNIWTVDYFFINHEKLSRFSVKTSVKMSKTQRYEVYLEIKQRSSRSLIWFWLILCCYFIIIINQIKLSDLFVMSCSFRSALRLPPWTMTPVFSAPRVDAAAVHHGIRSNMLPFSSQRQLNTNEPLCLWSVAALSCWRPNESTSH